MYAHAMKKTYPESLSVRHGVPESLEADNTLNYMSSTNHSVTQNSPINLLYVDAFKRVAKKYNIVLGIRAPNPLSETLLREGYPSKNFHMKAKSSPTGPTAGFIAEKPIYSKVPVSAHAKQSGYLDSALLKGAKFVNLNIGKSRIEELINTGNLIDLGDGNYCANYPSGLQKFIIKDNGSVLDDKFDPVRVMTNPPESGVDYADSRAITADYDLFSIIPHENQSNNSRPLKLAPKSLSGNFKLDFLKPAALPGQDEDVNMGNLHGYGKAIIRALNKEIADEGYRGGKLVWHNDETGNPFSPGFDIADKPIFVHPSGHVTQVHSKTELLKFYSQLRQERYAPEYSPVFGF